MNRALRVILIIFWFSNIQSGCFLPYVIKQGYYQAQLLYKSKPIVKVLRQDPLTSNQREKLELILKVRDFAIKKIGLSQNKNYTTINLSWAYTLYNISASQSLQFKPYTWWFPIIGEIPYKGFFDKSDAVHEKNRLTAKDLDVYMYTVPAYSSLGYFSDPVWPQMLELSIVSLTELIIHELAHTTVYFKNQTDFNESFANAVGKIGTLEFLSTYFGKNSREYQDAIKRYHDESLYNQHLWQLYQHLDTIYKSPLGNSQKYRLKNETILQYAKSYHILPFSTSAFKNIDLSHINNAFLMSFKRYHSEQENFERLLNYFEHNWQKFILKIRELENEPDPFMAFNKLVEKV